MSHIVGDPHRITGDAGMQAQYRENGDENGGNGVAEILAKAVVTSPVDDSLAIQYSILTDSQMVRTVESERTRYIILWPFMMLVAVWCCLLSVLYRIFVRPVSKERQLLGPERLTWWFDKLHPIAHQVRNGVTTSAALDAVYSVRRALPHPTGLRERLTRFWLDQPDAQATRNRLRITYSAVCAELDRIIDSGKESIEFLVLACGSAQASIEAVANTLKRHPHVHIRLILVDLSESSLRRAIRLAETRGVTDLVTTVPENLSRFVAKQPAGSWDIIEMVGFLDYRPRRSFVKTCSAIRRILAPNGLFMTAAMCPSPWAFVVRWVTNWPALIRRSPQEIDAMLEEAGFSIREANPEPHRIHQTFLCRK